MTRLQSQFAFQITVRRRLRVRGAAMVETVLALPFALLVLLLLVFLGQQWMRQQHVEDLAQYDAWQRAERAQGPADTGTYQTDVLRQADGVAIQVGDDLPPRLLNARNDAVGQVDAEAADLAQDVADAMPAGVLSEVDVDYAPRGVTGTLTRWFPQGSYGRAVEAYRLRMDQPWPFVLDAGFEHPADGSTDTVGSHAVLRERYMVELDEALEAIEASNGLASLTRRVIGQLSHYRGPAFPDE